jgi:hypothetical protein
MRITSMNPFFYPRRAASMTFQEDIDALKSRIAKAEFKRETWRAAGEQEKYLEAYFMVEALELQLDSRLRQPRN